MSKPNIFHIATKELSQDAFLTWFIKWADPLASEFDHKLHLCARDFVADLISRAGTPFKAESIQKLSVERQVRGIDIWVEVNEEYLIIIEDKIDARQHGNQLERYRNIAKEYCVKKDFKRDPVLVYLKTGNESKGSLSRVEAEGYIVFGRDAFLALLNDRSITNEIFLDFREHLNHIERLSTEWHDKSLSAWRKYDWQGFYQHLEQDLYLRKWGYVSNPQGGFWNALFSWEYWGSCALFLQAEQDQLCFKIYAHKDEIVLSENMSRGRLRNNTSKMLRDYAKSKDLVEIKRPARFGSGNTMTLAIADKSNWLISGEEGKVDVNYVIKSIEKYRAFFSGFIKEHEPVVK